MNFFEDRKIKKIARDEDIKAPDKYLKSVERTLNDLKNNNEILENYCLSEKKQKSNPKHPYKQQCI